MRRAHRSFAHAVTGISRGVVVRLTVLCMALLAMGRPLAAHEVPARADVLMLARADSSRLRLLVRVPLESVRDIDFPLWRGEYLDIARASPLLHEAATIWIAGYLELFEGDLRLPMGEVRATRISLRSDRAFDTFDGALRHASSAPLPNAVELPWRQAMLDVVLEYPVSAADARLSIRPLLAHLGVSTTTVLRWSGADGTERALTYTGNPGRVDFDPGVLRAAGQFVGLGFRHILGGIDHLLFLFCLILPFRRVRPLIGVVTAFTAAHSLTLIASALGMAPTAAWFPPLIEFLIALSIVLMALGNMIGPRLETRWRVAFGFGLIHGFGFSFALRESLQFAGGHLLASLLAFNVGVELGQLLVIAVAVPLLGWGLRRVAAERAALLVLSALVAHESWHWMTERFGVLRAYRFTWPAFDLALLAVVLRGGMLLLMIIAVLWAVAALVARLSRKPAGSALSATVLIAALLAVSPAPARAQAGESTRSTRAGVFTEQQAARGKDIYVGSCRECHVPASHTGVVFRNSWGGRRLSELLAYMTERMPKNSPGSLSSEEYAAVTAYILLLNGYPSGDEELPSDSTAASRIRIEMVGK
jgi:mono/diheme cytochrome c family protein